MVHTDFSRLSANKKINHHQRINKTLLHIFIDVNFYPLSINRVV